MAKLSLLALLFAGLLFAATCSPFGGASAFKCESDQECQGAFDGRCEPNGFCSFPDEACGPGGRRYGDLSGALGGKCTNDVPIDAGVDSDLIDSIKPEAGDTCLGSPGNGFANPCFSLPPSGALAITGPINTDSSSLCSTIVSNTTACVIAAGTITIDAGVTVTVTGGKPLVIAATTSVTITGTLDVASHIGVIAPGPAGNDPGCDPGTLPTGTGNVGGGGAGGSFGAKGGNGGNPNQGTSGAAQIPATLRGGCRAQSGHEGTGVAGSGGVGGNGGGAVYVIGGISISIAAAGKINASGAGGINGLTGGLAGGGGGGSGGFIGLDAPAVTNAGTIFANGGSGSEGTGSSAGTGRPGTDPSGIAAAVPQPPGSANGGDGGNGGAAPTNVGQPGLQATDGGGGGGGVGVIRVIPPQTLGGGVSPAPT